MPGDDLNSWGKGSPGDFIYMSGAWDRILWSLGSAGIVCQSAYIWFSLWLGCPQHGSSGWSDFLRGRSGLREYFNEQGGSCMAFDGLAWGLAKCSVKDQIVNSLAL